MASIAGNRDHRFGGLKSRSSSNSLGTVGNRVHLPGGLRGIVDLIDEKRQEKETDFP